MTEKQANSHNYYLNPFDATIVCPQDDFSLNNVSVLNLNQNSYNYFQDIEQVAFAMAHEVNGIGYLPDNIAKLIVVQS